MPRQARIVIPNVAHHVVQRGNRNQDTFFETQDYRTYLSLLKEHCTKANTQLLAYCLMTNHVHLILKPSDETGLQCMKEVHRRYTRYINMKHDWRGFLWQGRFSSYPMDDKHFYEALRYVELNPIRAGMCDSPEAYPWSSARQRILPECHDLQVMPLTNHMVSDWRSYWDEGLQKHQMVHMLQQNEISQKPLMTIGTR